MRLSTMKILNTARLDADVAREMLGQASIIQKPNPEKTYTKQELISLVGDVDAVILGGERFDRDVISAAQ
jgi:phosphoglycerate dehydrogenase-like enzyme